MAKILRPVFGKPCHDCEEQVPMTRVRIIESGAVASGRPFAQNRCVQCQSLYDNETKRIRAAYAARPRDVTIIRG